MPPKKKSAPAAAVALADDSPQQRQQQHDVDVVVDDAAVVSAAARKPKPKKMTELQRIVAAAAERALLQQQFEHNRARGSIAGPELEWSDDGVDVDAMRDSVRAMSPEALSHMLALQQQQQQQRDLGTALLSMSTSSSVAAIVPPRQCRNLTQMMLSLDNEDGDDDRQRAGSTNILAAGHGTPVASRRVRASYSTAMSSSAGRRRSKSLDLCSFGTPEGNTDGERGPGSLGAVAAAGGAAPVNPRRRSRSGSVEIRESDEDAADESAATQRPATVAAAPRRQTKQEFFVEQVRQQARDVTGCERLVQVELFPPAVDTGGCDDDGRAARLEAAHFVAAPPLLLLSMEEYERQARAERARPVASAAASRFRPGATPLLRHALDVAFQGGH